MIFHSCFRDTEGYSATTRFQIFCRNWKNFDPPTKYEFRYDNGADDGDDRLWYEGLVSENKPSVLPAGDPKNQNRITFKIRIINSYGSYAVFDSLSVTVSEFTSLQIFPYISKYIDI